MIEYASEQGIVTIRLARPERRNALSAGMIVALGDALARAGDDPDCRCVIVQGSDGNFCSGRELGSPPEPTLPAVLAYDEAYGRVFTRLRRLDKPSIAAVDGYAVAGGFTVAMGCDFVVATEQARFGALELKNGFPAAVNTALLSHLGPPRLMLEWLLTGDLISARRLYELGLINHLAADAEALQQTTRALADALAQVDPDAVRLGREAFQVAREMPLDGALAYGKNLNALLLASGRIAEAADTFARRQRERRGEVPG
jgi:enoyl-CoA hydratase/carnithine racemase